MLKKLVLILYASFSLIECKKVLFRLNHVIPANEAVKVYKSKDPEKINSFWRTQEDSNSNLSQLNLGEEISVQTRDDYLFQFASKMTMAQSEQYELFKSRIPPVIPQPDDHETITNFAKISANSYVARSIDGWHDDTVGYEDEEDFGWDGDGLRGYLFKNEDSSILILSFKGTSTILGRGDTVARDKYMDNMMFSCCCARVDMTWTPVCGCYVGKGSDGKSICDATCLKSTIQKDPDSYYNEALAITQLTIAKYPKAQLWFTGHSLGGAVAALMAVAVRKTSAITFSSPGPLLYSRHLGIYDAKDLESTHWQYPVWNYGLSCDPIFEGKCVGLTTSCYMSGYAMETSCRHGMDCTFDVSSWQPDVSTHRIDWFINHVLSKPEDHTMPQCLPNVVCNDCERWDHVETEANQQKK